MYAHRAGAKGEQVVLASGERSLSVVTEAIFSLSDLRGYMRERLPEYMVPARVVPLTALPLTPNGKIDHQALQTLEGDPSLIADAFVAPRTPLEVTLAEIWQRVLGNRRVGIHDNFFEIGGDSILSLQIVALARQRGLGFTTRQIFDRQTIAHLAPIVDASAAFWTEADLPETDVPLTPIQHWFFAQEMPEHSHWNMALMLEARESLNHVLLEQALEHLVAHHEVLRTSFSLQATGYRQQVHTQGPVSVPVLQIDLTALSPAEQAVTRQALCARCNRSLDLTAGPLMRVLYLPSGARHAHRLFIVIHHVLVDSVSLRIFCDDLQVLYHQLECNEQVHLPAHTTSFRYWAVKLQEYAGSQDLAHEGACWTTAMPSAVPALPVDLHFAGQPPTLEAFIRTVSLTLGAAETGELLEVVPRAYHARVNEALLTAFLQAMAAWTQTPALLIDLEGHGREELFEGVDLSRTIGWFTTQFPVWLDLGTARTPGEALQAIKEQVRAIPNQGIGYGVLRYLHTGDMAERLRALPQAAVRVNYLGQFERTSASRTLLRLLDEPCGPLYSEEWQRPYLLDITAGIVDGQLRLDIEYSERIHRRASIEKLAADVQAHLLELLAYSRSLQRPQFTPSDFPAAGFNQADLDAFLDQWMKEEK